MGDWSDERMGEWRVRSDTLSPGSEPGGHAPGKPGLDRQTLALVRIAVATATGDETKLRDRMIAARAVHVPPHWVDELLLQSFLNVGYPLALVAFGVWRSVAGAGVGREEGGPSGRPRGGGGATRGAAGGRGGWWGAVP